jgi:cytochrome c553
MKLFGVRGILIATILVSVPGAAAWAQLGVLRAPTWAFQQTEEGAPEFHDDDPARIPGSAETFSRERIGNLLSPPDWFPEENAPKPDIVLRGHGDALACGVCHLMSGLGHPESADLAGLPAPYIIRQLRDFRTGARKDISRMNSIAAVLSDREMEEAAIWFSSLTPLPWNRVVETNTVPRTFVGEGRMRFTHPDGGTEPIGNRIVTLPEDPVRARARDPKSGFIAYVPEGSLARGEELVRNGGNGRTVACTVCHGDDLRGLANVPRLAGLHSIYIARQLYLFKNGERAGIDSELMARPVEALTEEDIVAISAYLGSLEP